LDFQQTSIPSSTSTVVSKDEDDSIKKDTIWTQITSGSPTPAPAPGVCRAPAKVQRNTNFRNRATRARLHEPRLIIERIVLLEFA
jgi:hypothetical protein